MGKKTKIKNGKKLILALVVLLLVVAVVYGAIVIVVPYYWMPMSFHEKNIEKRANKRYFGDEYNYEIKLSNLKIYPLYNENDEITHYLVELEPYGYTYVTLTNGGLFYSFYQIDLSREELKPWQRFQYEDEFTPIDATINWEMDSFDGLLKECDEQGNAILRNKSPYSEANVLNEKLYFIQGKIPSVKRGDKYLNLISMELYEIESNLKMPTQEPKNIPKAYL